MRLQPLSLSTSVPIFDFHGQSKMMAASLSKLITSYAALDLLGTTYTFQTFARWDGSKEKNGVLEAPLVIRGEGDPFMVTERLWLFAERIALSGLKHLKAGMVIDQSFYVDYPEFQLKEAGLKNGGSLRPYLAPISPTALNFNTLTFLITPSLTSGSSLQAHALPMNSWVQVQNRLKVGKNKNVSSRRLSPSESPRPTTYLLEGTVPSNQDVWVYEAVLQPETYFGEVLKSMLEALGVKVDGAVTLASGKGPPLSQPRQIQFDSLPLADLVRLMNVYSNNFMADAFVFALGRESDTASYSLGRNRVIRWLNEQHIGVDWEDYTLGSGLSRKNKLSAQATVELICKAWHKPRVGMEFVASLPVSGMNGTLKGAIHLPLLRAKTGNLMHVSNLAGILYSASQTPYAFGLLMHHPKRDSAQIRDEVHRVISMAFQELH
jgi:D-alanyl-D-alanine carboxypeptidase/D-alanyl-D-alanine-endopeptidase (penicillin-binding protein 4)